MRSLLRIPFFTQTLIWTLIVTTLVIGWCPPQGWAMLAPAVTAEGSAESGRTADLQTIQRALESKIVQQRLQDWGLTQDEVQTRLAQLSDQDVHQMAMQIDALMPGGELGLIIALLVIAILVVLVLYLTGNKIVVEKSNGVIEKK
ncbi:MAG TPA: PA2779 family protein [Nitrospiraceae bacterium]|nr:PA2779 family protein [Nitrospiraceae bacterium]